MISSSPRCIEVCEEGTQPLRAKSAVSPGELQGERGGETGASSSDALTVVLVAMGLCATAAFGASPHFKKGGTPKCRDTGTQLVCSGSLAGLGNEDVDIVLTADAEATFFCVNPSGKNEPLGQNKVPFEASGSEHFDASEIKNGNLSFSVSAPQTPP